MANGFRITVIASVAGLAVSMAGLIGCASRQDEPARLLRTEDFLADRESSRAVAQSPVPLEDQPPTAPPERTADRPPSPAPQEPRDIIAVPGAPLLSPAAAQPVESPVLINAKVGEINGRPVMAAEILDISAPRLRQVALEPGMTRQRWIAEAYRDVRTQLEFLLRDELLHAEALASLKPEQKIGLRYMVQEMTENVRRQSGGSLAAAQRRLQETENQTIQQAQRTRQTRLLIDYQLQEKIRKRVRVSWKDVRLYYERNFEQFNPPAIARIRMIRVPAGDEAAVARVKEELAAGRPFAQVATLPENTFNPERGGLRESPLLIAGSLATADLDLPDALADALRGLTVGTYNVEPVDFLGRRGTDKAWVFLESIEQRRRPLSDRDVQREIAEHLSRTQLDREVQLHIERLRERASFTDLDEMARRLVEIAIERYWPQG